MHASFSLPHTRFNSLFCTPFCVSASYERVCISLGPSFSSFHRTNFEDVRPFRQESRVVCHKLLPCSPLQRRSHPRDVESTLIVRLVGAVEVVGRVRPQRGPLPRGWGYLMKKRAFSYRKGGGARARKDRGSVKGLKFDCAATHLENKK